MSKHPNRPDRKAPAKAAQPPATPRQAGDRSQQDKRAASPPDRAARRPTAPDASRPDAASHPEAPQLYLVTPLGAAASALGPLLGEVLNRVPVACVRIRAGDDIAELGRVADTVREICHARDIAVVIDDHIGIAQTHGLDGVHLTDGSRGIRGARRDLGADAIIGVFCGGSRHDGLIAGEAGADYVSFGPVGDNGPMPGEPVPLDLFAWWSEMIEVPVVAEGSIDAATLAALWPVADFIAIGAEIWAEDDPAQTLARLWNQPAGSTR